MAAPETERARIERLEDLTLTNPDAAAAGARRAVLALLREHSAATEMAFRRSEIASGADGDPTDRIPDGRVFHDRMLRLKNIMLRHTMFDTAPRRQPVTGEEIGICGILEMLLQLHP